MRGPHETQDVDPAPRADGLVPRTTARGERRPTVVTALVAVGLFLVQYPLSILGLVGLGLFALDPTFLREPWTLLTSVYAHASPGHLLANLVGLVLCGGLVERVSSRARFHAFVVLTGALSGVAEVTLGSLVALDARAVVGHAAGLSLGLLAGRRRVLHVRSR